MKGKLALVALLMFGVFSCVGPKRATVVPPLSIAGAQYVGMDRCVRCHRQHVERYQFSTHGRLNVKSMETEGHGCGMCHGPASAHIENPYDPKKIFNPRRNPEVCFRCHLTQMGEFRLQYHHPVLEGRVSCADCHDDLMGLKGEFDALPWTITTMKEVNEVCFKCHKEFRGPFVYEHEALREGCTICHKVHGSVHDKLLLARDHQLCLQCHFQDQLSPSTTLMVGTVNHAALWAQGPCMSAFCHTAVHGSNFDIHLRY